MPAATDPRRPPLPPTLVVAAPSRSSPPSCRCFRGARCYRPSLRHPLPSPPLPPPLIAHAAPPTSTTVPARGRHRYVREQRTADAKIKKCAPATASAAVAAAAAAVSFAAGGVLPSAPGAGGPLSLSGRDGDSSGSDRCGGTGFGSGSGCGASSRAGESRWRRGFCGGTGRPGSHWLSALDTCRGGERAASHSEL